MKERNSSGMSQRITTCAFPIRDSTNIPSLIVAHPLNTQRKHLTFLEDLFPNVWQQLWNNTSKWESPQLIVLVLNFKKYGHILLINYMSIYIRAVYNRIPEKHISALSVSHLARFVHQALGSRGKAMEEKQERILHMTV